MNCNYHLFCVAGLYLTFAYDDISYHKVATQSHTYTGTGYDANNAVDGNTATCMRTNALGKNTHDKTLWWKVDLGGVHSIYRISILFKNYDGYDVRQRGRFAGFSLYVTNTGDIQGSTLCYKDGPQLPPLNFTATCAKCARYVIFYNERLDGVTYPIGYEVDNVLTELCEVAVQGCNNASFYGSNCDIPCPTNCDDSTCHIQSGACFTCKPGWSGVNCNTKCVGGWYGRNCSQQCVGHCSDQAFCNHVSGQCDKGCDTGWTDNLCNKECDSGTYGYNCRNNCSGHCLNNSPCNKQTGYCDGGCNPGYTDSDCRKTCPPGQYGINCKEICSSQCMNNEPCDPLSGVCLSGCQDGFVGAYCNSTCKEGYFGINCSQKCSPYCRPNTCRHKDRSCAGGIDHNCTTENVVNSDLSHSVVLVIGLSMSILINLIFIVCGILFYRRSKSRKMDVLNNLLSCWKWSIYQDIVVKTEETSTYQELDLSENAYQNNAIR